MNGSAGAFARAPREGPREPLSPVLEDMLQQSVMALMLRLLEHYQEVKYFIFRIKPRCAAFLSFFATRPIRHDGEAPARGRRRARFRPFALGAVEKKKF